MLTPNGLIILSGIGLTLILLHGKILKVPRDKLKTYLKQRSTNSEEMDGWNLYNYLLEILDCSMCMGFWVGLILGQSILMGFAVSITSYLTDQLLDLIERS